MLLWLQVALTKHITSRARLEDVARAVIAAATDKLLEVGLDEHKVRPRQHLICSICLTPPVLHVLCLGSLDMVASGHALHTYAPAIAQLQD
jgi:hypothetical protein